MYVKHREQSIMLRALLDAQKLALSPFIFQACASAKELGIFRAIGESAWGLTVPEIAKAARIEESAAQVLVHVLQAADILTRGDTERIELTKIGECLVFNQMTVANFDFVNNVCYKGLAHLKDSLWSGKPEGLKELGDWPTIYRGLKDLPEPAKTSWSRFDDFHSDQYFGDAAEWFMKSIAPRTMFDVGGDQGRFVGMCLRKMPDLHAVIVDLPEQCETAKKNPENASVMERISTAEVDWLDPAAMPATDKKADLIWMCQILDCFTPDQAVSILKRCKEYLAPGGHFAILESLYDEQKYDAVSMSIVCMSLYHRTMANGNSHFFSGFEFRAILEKAGLEIEAEDQVFGISQRMFVCRPKAES